MVKLCETIAVSPEEMRHAYCNALIEAAKKDPRIVSLDCDLSSSCGTTGFRKAFPDRAFNLGIQEQNACAMAGGLSAAGLVPFFHTFAVFATRRVYDQAFLSCAYAGQNVKIVGCDAGVSAAFSITRKPVPFREARKSSEENLAFAMDNILRLLEIKEGNKAGTKG